jgi:hypothetical protein
MVESGDKFGDGLLFGLPEEEGIELSAVDGVGGAWVEVVAFEEGSDFFLGGEVVFFDGLAEALGEFADGDGVWGGDVALGLCVGEGGGEGSFSDGFDLDFIVCYGAGCEGEEEPGEEWVDFFVWGGEEADDSEDGGGEDVEGEEGASDEE